MIMIRTSFFLILISFLLPVESIPLLDQVYQDADLITPLLIFLLIMHVLSMSEKRQFFWKVTPIDPAILVLLLTQLQIIIFSPYTLDTMIRYVKYDKVFILYYLFVNYVDDWKKIKAVVYAYLISSALIGVYGLIAALGYTLSGTAPWGFVDTHAPRFEATLQDPNILAVYMITPLILTISLLLFDKKQSFKSKALLTTLVTLLSFTISITLSRSGTFGLVISIITLFFLNIKNITRKFASLLLLLTTIALSLLLASLLGLSPSRLLTRLTNADQNTTGSNSFHYYIKSMSIEIFKEYPFGVGRGNALRYIGETSTEIQLFFLENFGMNSIGEIFGEYQGWWPLHSSWLEFIVGEGVIGLCCFVFIIAQTFKQALLATKQNGSATKKLLLTSFTAGLTGMLVSAIFYTFDSMYFFWFIITMIIVISRHIISEADHGRNPPTY